MTNSWHAFQSSLIYSPSVSQKRKKRGSTAKAALFRERRKIPNEVLSRWTIKTRKRTNGKTRGFVDKYYTHNKKNFTVRSVKEVLEYEATGKRRVPKTKASKRTDCETFVGAQSLSGATTPLSGISSNDEASVRESVTKFGKEGERKGDVLEFDAPEECSLPKKKRSKCTDEENSVGAPLQSRVSSSFVPSGINESSALKLVIKIKDGTSSEHRMPRKRDVLGLEATGKRRQPPKESEKRPKLTAGGKFVAISPESEGKTSLFGFSSDDDLSVWQWASILKKKADTFPTPSIFRKRKCSANGEQTG